jgi:hypothetical protein
MCVRDFVAAAKLNKHGHKMNDCTCYHPLVFNQFGDLERCTLRPGNVHSADGWESVFKPVIVRYQGKVLRIYFRAESEVPGSREPLPSVTGRTDLSSRLTRQPSATSDAT